MLLIAEHSHADTYMHQGGSSYGIMLAQRGGALIISYLNTSGVHVWVDVHCAHHIAVDIAADL